ncbi:hypothetical protein Cgig2_019459 [Carnegiea gigantea]|uniref:Glutamine amidotransferase domain-containing protein n=1 Tax=Carnegiea gigantea TaxID=171969 RepID=A0A9Q1QPC8_9CARY|nr:hypothetical protein Cgig2_019459 [Carnegiea gigantea]
MVNLIPKEDLQDQLEEETQMVLLRETGIDDNDENTNGSTKLGINQSENPKKFAVLLCADDSEYVKKRYGGYFGVFVRMLAEEGEIWDVYRVAGNEFPDDGEIDGYDGFVITGSCNDAHASSSKLFPNLKISSMLNIIECHQDEVSELPPEAEVIGRSNKTSIEMFRYGDHVMGIQGHPEYNKDILLHLIDRLLQKKFIEDNYANELRTKFMESRDPDKDAWRKLCVSFLKGRL